MGWVDPVIPVRACMLQQDIKTHPKKSLKQKNVKVSTHNEIQSSQQTPRRFTKSIKRQKISEVKTTPVSVHAFKMAAPAL